MKRAILIIAVIFIVMAGIYGCGDSTNEINVNVPPEIERIIRMYNLDQD